MLQWLRSLHRGLHLHITMVVVVEVDMEVVEIGAEIATGTEALDLIDISMVEIDHVLTERFGIEHFIGRRIISKLLVAKVGVDVFR